MLATNKGWPGQSFPCNGWALSFPKERIPYFTGQLVVSWSHEDGSCSNED